MLFWEENSSFNCNTYCYDGNKEDFSLHDSDLIQSTCSSKMTSADNSPITLAADARDEVEMIEKINNGFMDMESNNDKTNSNEQNRQCSCPPSCGSSYSYTSGGSSTSLIRVDELKPLDDDDDMVVFIPLRRGNSSRARFQKILDQASQLMPNNDSSLSSSSSTSTSSLPHISNETTLFQTILHSSFGKSYIGRHTIMLIKAPKASLSYLVSEDQ